MRECWRCCFEKIKKYIRISFWENKKITVDFREFCQPFLSEKSSRFPTWTIEWKSESNSSSGSRWVQRSPIKPRLIEARPDPIEPELVVQTEARFVARCRDLALSRLLILERRLNAPILSRNTSARRGILSIARALHAHELSEPHRNEDYRCSFTVHLGSQIFWNCRHRTSSFRWNWQWNGGEGQKWKLVVSTEKRGRDFPFIFFIFFFFFKLHDVILDDVVQTMFDECWQMFDIYIRYTFLNVLNELVNTL